MSDLTVYRSRNPAVLAAWNVACGAIRAYVKDTKAVLDAAGLSRYQVYRSTGGFRPGEIRGLAIPQDEFPPEGWRQGKTMDFAVPDKRTKAGREIAGALGAVKHPGDPLLALPGMPADVMVGGGFQTPGVRLLEDSAALYVTWRTDPATCRQSFMSKSTDIDGVLWERVKLSEYYATVEATEAGHEPAGGAA